MAILIVQCSVNTEQEEAMDFGYVLKTLRIEAGVGLRELARVHLVIGLVGAEFSTVRLSWSVTLALPL